MQQGNWQQQPGGGQRPMYPQQGMQPQQFQQQQRMYGQQQQPQMYGQMQPQQFQQQPQMYPQQMMMPGQMGMPGAMPGTMPGSGMMHGGVRHPTGFNPGDPPTMPDSGAWQATPDQKKHYDTLFNQADAGGLGKIQGLIAFQYLSRSKLPKESLREVRIH
jgi:hypothetical protein